MTHNVLILSTRVSRGRFLTRRRGLGPAQCSSYRSAGGNGLGEGRAGHLEGRGWGGHGAVAMSAGPPDLPPFAGVTARLSVTGDTYGAAAIAYRGCN